MVQLLVWSSETSNWYHSSICTIGTAFEYLHLPTESSCVDILTSCTDYRIVIISFEIHCKWSIRRCLIFWYCHYSKALALGLSNYSVLAKYSGLSTILDKFANLSEEEEVAVDDACVNALSKAVPMIIKMVIASEEYATWLQQHTEDEANNILASFNASGISATVLTATTTSSTTPTSVTASGTSATILSVTTTSLTAPTSVAMAASGTSVTVSMVTSTSTTTSLTAPTSVAASGTSATVLMVTTTLTTILLTAPMLVVALGTSVTVSMVTTTSTTISSTAPQH